MYDNTYLAVEMTTKENGTEILTVISPKTGKHRPDRDWETVCLDC